MDQATTLGSEAHTNSSAAKLGLSGPKAVGSAFGAKRLRVAPWQGNRFVALVGPIRNGRRPQVTDIERCLVHLGDRAVSEAVTPAMSAVEAEPYLRAGFKHFERLHLLSCPLPSHQPSPSVGPGSSRRAGGVKLTNAHSWHRDQVLAIDANAFQGFWRFDRRALNEARSATGSRRYRLARHDGKIVGYAITGRAGHRGYLQRLAVDPAFQGQGIGTMLVNDGFEWLGRNGVTSCMVNTQESNDRALALYERLGFRQQPQGLFVLQWKKGP